MNPYITDEDIIYFCEQKLGKNLVNDYFFNQKKIVELSEIKKEINDLIKQYTIKELRIINGYLILRIGCGRRGYKMYPFLGLPLLEILRDRNIANTIIGINKGEILYYRDDSGFTFKRNYEKNEVGNIIQIRVLENIEYPHISFWGFDWDDKMRGYEMDRKKGLPNKLF